MSDQTLLAIDGQLVSTPDSPPLHDENTPVILHFSIGEGVVEGNPVIPITVVGNIPCVGFFVSTSPNLPPDPAWIPLPPQSFNLDTESFS